MSNKLALYIKHDTPNAEWKILATETFSLSSNPTVEHVNQLKAQRTLETVRSQWIHNGPPEYLRATYKIAVVEYSWS